MTMRNYLTADPEITGYPVGDSLFYECTRCGTVLPSQPPDNIACTCNNILIDVEWGRVRVKDHSQFKMFAVADTGGGSASKNN